MILFWQFAISSLEEIDIVSNQNLSMEMFLIRLIYLKDISDISKIIDESKIPNESKIKNENNIMNQYNENEDLFDLKNKTIGQIKNVIQEKQSEHKLNNKEEKQSQEYIINSFNDLLKVCTSKKEMKLKYELEKNVNLVSFENLRMEISFHENLDKEFIKILSSKLYEWTGNRWIITLSKKKGKPSIKENEINLQKDLLEKAKKEPIYKNFLEIFPDGELIDIEIVEKNND